ncbi:MAG: AraC family transcriptional regulator [Oscillibacter sp.]|nr:AraC family transcriptional regulator [Oscillibacter sp.]
MDRNNQEFTYYKAKHVTCLKYRHESTLGLYPTFCGVEQCKPGFSVGPRVRDNYHLHVILSGKGTLCVSGRTYHLHSNQAFLLKPAETVFYQADQKDPWRYCWVSFNGASAKDCMRAAGFPDGVNARDCYMDTNEFLMLTWKLLECRDNTLQNELRCLSLTTEFIALMIESGDRVAPPRRQDDSSDIYVDHALDVIRCQYANVKIRDIAKHIGINRSYLTNIFKKRTGLSPQEYLLRYRLNIACRLLLTTNYPIQEVARQIGYENPMTFSKMFKSAYGVSPKVYRSQGVLQGPAAPQHTTDTGREELT